MEQMTEVKKEGTGLEPRPPIVVVMGHIDHGKSSILDAVRKTNTVAKEAGGITQGIGAYQIEVPTPVESGSESRPHASEKITFIDTPGHEAFSAMRGRGAHVADVAVLVVAADEGVKPQTEEAIRIIQESELPFVVAINKMDKPAADPNRVKKELAEREVLVEGFGGTVPAVEISAKTGHGIEALLETILLLVELEELTSDPAKPGEGVVIESHLDPRRGATATLLIEEGIVRKGDFMVIADQVAPVRIFENFRGESIGAASASEPIRIAGFRSIPPLGERFAVFNTRAEAESKRLAGAPPQPAAAAVAPSAAAKKTMVNLILKTDLLGSKEALESSLAAIGSPELGNRLLKSDVGDINETDIKLAQAMAHTVVVGFKVKIPPAVKELAERAGVRVVLADVIYDLLDQVKAAMVAVAPAEVRRADLGQAKILALFKADAKGQIVGGRVEQGSIRVGSRFDLIRNELKIASGRIISLQANRNDVEEVGEGSEFGILTDTETAIAVGDTLQVFREEKVAPTL